MIDKKVTPREKFFPVKLFDTNNGNEQNEKKKKKKKERTKMANEYEKRVLVPLPVSYDNEVKSLRNGQPQFIYWNWTFEWTLW